MNARQIKVGMKVREKRNKFYSGFVEKTHHCSTSHRNMVLISPANGPEDVYWTDVRNLEEDK